MSKFVARLLQRSRELSMQGILTSVPNLSAISLTRRGTVVSASESELFAFRHEFERFGCIRLTGFLRPELLDLLRNRIRDEDFRDLTHKGIGAELSLSADHVAVHLLLLLANEPILHRSIEAVTGMAGIKCFSGRIYRMCPSSGHYDSWHTDNTEHRWLGMSVNLSPVQYQGGTFKLRSRENRESIVTAENVRVGDAIIFRIAANFEHRVTNVEGSNAKTAFAGWFRGVSNFYGDRMPLRTLP